MKRSAGKRNISCCLAIFFLFVTRALCLPAHGGQDPAPAILHTVKPYGWLLQTRSSSYQVIVTAGGAVREAYYGPRVAAADLSGDAGSHLSDRRDEVPARGGYPFKTASLELVFADGVRNVELEYVKGEIDSLAGYPVLKIVQKDRYYPLTVASYIRVLPEFNVLEKWTVIKNTGAKESMRVENLLSGNIALPPDEYKLTQLAGKQMNEFQLYQSLLTPGLKSIENKSFKSNFNPPWFAVQPQTHTGPAQPTWFGSLHYSGNWILNFDQAFAGSLQISGGINFWDTDIPLRPGASFESPRLTLGFSPGGLDGAARDLSAYIRETVLPPVHRHALRPVLFNSWYATTYFMNEPQQENMAELAAKLGVELFVIDDGWYKGRRNSASGLGDWVVDSTRFPGGLTPLIRKVHSLGMKFGIWVEPENINVNSDVYRQHPDWVLRFPNRENKTARRTLNLAREVVFRHLLDVLSKLLSENKIDFVKWDQNSYLLDPGWPDAPPEMQRSVRIRYIANLYRLVDSLKERFPSVWFESCASGGGRVDLGMMSRMDQAWVSDNSTALDRLFIQYGYLGALPANTMVSWVIDRIGSRILQHTSLDFRFDVAMSGVPGIGYDIRDWTPEQFELAKKKIAEYKEIRPLVQQGTLYRLVSPFRTNRCALQYVSKDSTTAVVFCYNLADYLPESGLVSRGSKALRLQGLKRDKWYRLKLPGDLRAKEQVYSGRYLMEAGIPWSLNGSFQSRIIEIMESNAKTGE